MAEAAAVTVTGVTVLEEISIPAATEVAPSTTSPEAEPGYKLIIHTLPSGITAPSVSPFVLKLETYLRMAGIKYTINTDKPFGSKGKTPWITFTDENKVSQNIDDSQIIIEFLNKKLNLDLWGNATKEEKASAHAMRILLENHFILGLADWRWVSGVHTINKIWAVSGVRGWAMKMFLPRRVKGQLYNQGFGRHTKEQQMDMIIKDLIAISDYLGDKPFFLGADPTEVDATLFGVMAQYVYCAPGSPYEKIIEDDYKNLKAYCERMKEKFWKDWDSLLHK